MIKRMRRYKEKHDKDAKSRELRGEEVQPFDPEIYSKKMAKRWRKESSEVTRLFIKAALLEHAMLGEDEILVRKKKKEAKIKENCHPYLLFCKEQREELGSRYNGKEILSVLSDMWKKLSSEEKAQYAEKAQKNKRLQTDTFNQVNVGMIPPEPIEQMYVRGDPFMFK